MLPGASFRGVASPEHTTDTGDPSPQYQPPFAQSPAQLQIMKTEMQNRLTQGILPPRLVYDYRRLNKVTKPDVYPLLNVETLLDQLGGKSWFSKLDLFSGFWHVPVAEKDREKTGVITHVGLYQFRRLPFGLRNAPATFQRLMNTTIADMLLPRDEDPYLSGYVDDLLCHSVEWKQHVKHLENVFILWDKAGLTLKPSKCKLCQHKQDFLGYKINSEGRQPDPAKIKAVAQFSRPKKATDVQQLLGLAGFYRHHIQFFASRS